MREYKKLSKYLNQACALYNEYIEKTDVTFFEHKLSPQEFYFKVIPRKEGFNAYAIIDDKEFMGYVYLSPYSNKDAYRKTAEITIYLKQDKKRKHIGKDACEFIEKDAKENGVEQIIALITATNKESINFFRSLNYKYVGTLKNVGYKFNKYLSVEIWQKSLI